MELRERVIAPCSINDAKTGQILGGDLGSLLFRVLLFEENIVDSTYLREVPTFIDIIGPEQLILLVNEGNVRFKCDPRVLADYGGFQSFPDPRRRGTLRLVGTYKIDLGWDLDPHQWLNDALNDLLAGLKVSAKEASKLAVVIAQNSIIMPSDYGRHAIAQFERDVRSNNCEQIRRSLAHVLETERGLAASDASTVRMEILPLDAGGFNVATNLDSLGVSPGDQHEVVRSGLWGAAGFYFRLEEMRELQSISGFQPTEMPLFDAKVDLLAKQIMPDAQAERFRRVLTIAGLPDPGRFIHSGGTIGIEHFIKIRDSAECRRFRSWLRTLDSASDEEIEQEVSSLRAKTAEIMESTPGRVLRFGTITGAGLIPGIGLPLGIGLGAIDGFVLDRLIGEPGPAVFLGRHYRSIFDQ